MNASSHSVLIVEDNLDDLYILKRSFRVAGISADLHHVEDGEQAIDYLQGVTPFSDRTAYPLPSLVLLDLKLPLKDGFEVLRWIRQQPHTMGLIVLILTSSSDDGDVRKAYDFGANAFLVKPISTDRLTEMIRAVDMFWLQHNKFQPHP